MASPGFIPRDRLLAIAGVVVNDSLVMVDYINRQREDGRPLFDAVLESGAARFRAILLTSLTTFGGLVPLLMEKSVQAQFLIPMAVSISFGLAVATLLVLIVIPALLNIHERIAERLNFSGRTAIST